MIPNPDEQLHNGSVFCPVFALFAFFAVYNSLPELGMMYACNHAVALAPSDDEMFANRGVARALVGDYAGAIEDLQESLPLNEGQVIPFPSAQQQESDRVQKRKEQRKRWIAALERGENPFTEDVLEELRGE